MKKTIYKKILAAGSALLVLLSLAGCVREEPVQADAVIPPVPPAEAPASDVERISSETQKTSATEAFSPTEQAVQPETEEPTATDTPATVPEVPAEQPVETPTEAPTEAPTEIPAPESPALVAPEAEEESLPEQNPQDWEVDVPDERPTFEGMKFVYAEEIEKAKYEASRYPDLQYTKPNTGDSILDNWLSFVLEHHELTMVVGESYQMVYTFYGSDTVKWRSEDESVFTVDQTGRISAHAPGQARLVAVSGECGARTCQITVVEKILTKEEQARAVAQQIAWIILNDPTVTTDIERIAYAARFINAYVGNGHTTSFHEDSRTAYGTLVSGYSNCVGSTKATGLVLEYMGFSWRHVNAGQNSHQWCEVYGVDGQTAFCDGSAYGVVGFGTRQEDGANWLYMNSQGQLIGYNEYFG